MRNDKNVLEYLSEYIILNLNEINTVRNRSDFNEGELSAYVECLEILSEWRGFKKFGINDIEKSFGVI